MNRFITSILVVFISMSGWLQGADTGSISGILGMRDFQSRFADRYNPISNSYSYSAWRQALLTGTINAGCLFGAMLSSPFTERIGKKYSICFFSGVYIIAELLLVTAVPSWIQVLVGKILAGVGIGALSVLSPGYQSEVAPPQIRGAVVATYQIFSTGAALVAACINMGTHKLRKTASWRTSFGINMLWGILLMVGVLFLPESPRYLIYKGRDEEALRIMCNMAELSPESEIIQTNFNTIKSDIEIEMAGGKARWIEIFGKDIRYRTCLGFLVMLFRELIGNNYYFYYATQVFKGTGMTDIFLPAVILGAINFGTTFGALYTIDNLGRRNPLIFGAAFQSICFFIYAAVGDRKLIYKNGTSDHRAGSVMIVFSCLFLFSYCCSWGPMGWVIVGETFPIRYRSKCASVATSGNWLGNFMISFFTPFINNAIGFKLGYIYACINLFSSFMIFFLAKETKGLTLEEVNDLYMSNIKPWESYKYVREIESHRIHFSKEEEKREREKSKGIRGQEEEFIENADEDNNDSSSSSGSVVSAVKPRRSAVSNDRFSEDSHPTYI
ncbi:plasma membrane gluconate:proton symporter Ght3 [Schizosaccharomyces pombe]|uniref:High-affinity gluconate transporter ght3 n=1 Tax=Schizosaccharomyces pombe (strain 972 / ATCC 24843) TaxID=284812 RepID=GHT3_SCHPO|nr:hexose transporter Ght3 [Schizosaccharomyces pombe]Q92339.1 RecName: Full=High-affinity gluconate transporter ght3; AltName: Full=Hexose transporter 3 [Schizosaccharomyces pombe 972h-]AAC63975.1 putative glucose transporter protein [Schizosaccharomyces pombe]CAB03595.1 hexose transporter Ght3 [Schizosaccharomyces pombe]|eukprot:NP_592790.1 hexose transporter Ght3 [Schizosaccharomyces pombe]